MTEYNLPEEIQQLKLMAYALAGIIVLGVFIILHHYARIEVAANATIGLIIGMMLFGFLIRKYNEYKISYYYENAVRQENRQDCMMGEVRELHYNQEANEFYDQ